LTARASADRAAVTYWTAATADERGRFRVEMGMTGETWIFLPPGDGTRPHLVKLGQVEKSIRALDITVPTLRAGRRVRFVNGDLPLAGAKLVLVILSEGDAQPNFAVTLDDEGTMPADLLTPDTLYGVIGGRKTAGSRMLDWTGTEDTVDLSKLEGNLTRAERARRERLENEGEKK
jgi:hypothetical protein